MLASGARAVEFLDVVPDHQDDSKRGKGVPKDFLRQRHVVVVVGQDVCRHHAEAGEVNQDQRGSS